MTPALTSTSCKDPLALRTADFPRNIPLIVGVSLCVSVWATDAMTDVPI